MCRAFSEIKALRLLAAAFDVVGQREADHIIEQSEEQAMALNYLRNEVETMLPLVGSLAATKRLRRALEATK